MSPAAVGPSDLAPAADPLVLARHTTEQVLRLARERLGMALAYVSHLTDEEQIVDQVDGDWAASGIRPGASVPLADSYCAHVVSGDLPALVPDAPANPVAAGLPSTAAIGIGSYATTLLRSRDGEIYGTLCCLDPQPHPELGRRDLEILSLLGDLLADAIESELTERRRETELRRKVRGVIDGGGPHMVFQPLFNVDGPAVVGYEALARFPGDFPGPAEWFHAARSCGLGVDLEIAALTRAREALADLPDGLDLAINMSADAICSGDLTGLLDPAQASRIIIEITEHEEIVDYQRLQLRIAELRATGIRFAVDDAGAGYAGMRQLVELAPDIIKMDYHITHGMDRDPARLAVATALATFARTTGAHLLAEGVETAAEFETAVALGIGLAQGYYLGRPARMPDPVTRDDAADLPVAPGTTGPQAAGVTVSVD
ncbi:EAL domain-containing protein [Nakamurella alba]|nr:EAL domain-containing protein [Nakamurella alba]